MFRVIVWKELREQGLIGLTLVVLGAGVLVAARRWPTRRPTGAAGRRGPVPRGRALATLMLAVTAGMVCGGAVFAAEREAGTIAFLESLPVTRWRLWRAKAVAGLGLAAAQIGLLVAVAAGLGWCPTGRWALAGGRLRPARVRLGDVRVHRRPDDPRVGRGRDPGRVLTAFVVLIPVVLFFQRPGRARRPSGAVLFLAGCSPSRWPVGVAVHQPGPGPGGRRRGGPSGSRLPGRRATAASGAGPRVGIASPGWLAVRQLRFPGAGALGVRPAVRVGPARPRVQPLLAWPALALAAGVLAGVTAFADEQTRGSARFWGEQRLPLGRAWVVKIGAPPAVRLWLLFLLAVPLVIRRQFEPGPRAPRAQSLLAVVFSPRCSTNSAGRPGSTCSFRRSTGSPPGTCAGWCSGSWWWRAGWRGSSAGSGRVAWGPSLLAGGVSHWQLWLPPAVVLLTARLLLPAWAADRLATRRPLGTLAARVPGGVLATGAGRIGYRVLEVPDRAGRRGRRRVRRLAAADRRERGGRDVPDGGRAVRPDGRRRSHPEFDARPRSPGRGDRLRVEERPTNVVRHRVAGRASRTWRRGWTRLFDALPEPNDRAVAGHGRGGGRLRGHPVGIYEYPQLIGAPASAGTPPPRTPAGWPSPCWPAGSSSRPPGTRRRSSRALPTVLALARTLRNGSTVIAFQIGIEVERLAFFALDRWLDLAPSGSRRGSPSPRCRSAGRRPSPTRGSAGVPVARHAPRRSPCWRPPTRPPRSTRPPTSWPSGTSSGRR